MKFTNGFWVTKDAISANYAVQVYEAEEKDGSLIVYAPCRPVKTRGDTLGMPLLTIKYSSPCDNVLRVTMSHFEGALKKGPFFDVKTGKNSSSKITINDKTASLKTGSLEVRVNRDGPWKVEYSGDNTLLTKSESKSAGYMQEHEGPVQHMFYSKTKAFVKDELTLGVGEFVYGLGERFGSFVKNGQTVDIWNSDGGTASEQAYKNIPFYMTNKGYGVFVNNPGKVSFEVGSEKVSRVQFSVPGEELDYYIIYGPEPKKILERYTELTGRPPLLPEWTYGLWLSTSFTTNYDEKTVMHFIDGMAERNIPLSVFHFDCFWMKGFHWSDFVWDSETFPDPKGLIERLHKKGLKVCVWINSYIAQQSILFKEGCDKGYFIKKTDGSVWQTDLWQSGMAIVDFTNPEACKWYASKLETLLDMGVDAFKTDFGERIPDDCVYFDGSDSVKMHNYYTFLYNKCVFDLLERKKGKGNACLFARSATAGGQQFPVHWGGDCESTFESMAETLRGGLSLGLSGFGYWSHDIGGFEGNPPPALFKRWLAFGLLSSHSRLHGSNSYRVPWSVDEESGEVARVFACIKEKIKPQLMKAAQEAHEKGIPVLRAMVLEFPHDPACTHLDRQYMLGSSILAAPVFSETNEVEYYMPAGKWKHLIDGRDLDLTLGGRWIKENYDFMSLPLWERQ